LKAKAEAYDRVLVHSEGRMENVTQLLLGTTIAVATVLAQHNPEIILPYLRSFVTAIYSNDCYNASRRSGSCVDIVDAASDALHLSMDKYNAGLFSISGLSAYLKSLSNFNSIDIFPTIKALLEVYTYLSEAMSTVGFAAGDGTQLVQSLLESCDDLINQLHAQELFMMQELDLNTASTDDHLMASSIFGVNPSQLYPQLLQSVYALSANYFSIFPFGYAQSFQSSQRFNISMHKGYWDQSRLQSQALSQARILGIASTQLGEGVELTSVVFPTNHTMAYSSLLVSSAVAYLSSSTGDGNHSVMISESRYVQFSLDAAGSDSRKEAISAELKLRFSLPSQRNISSINGSVLMVQTNLTEPYQHYQRCNKSIPSSPVICSAAQTGGYSYTFPVNASQQACGNGTELLAFRCPLYATQLLCLLPGNRTFAPQLDAVDSMGIICTFPVLLGNDSSQAGTSLETRGTYSLASSPALISAAHLTTTTLPVQPTAAPLLSQAEGMSYLAIVSIGVVGIAFAAFVYSRLKAAHVVGSVADRTEAHTIAEYVQTPQTVRVDEVEIDLEASVAAQDQSGQTGIEYQAVALPIIAESNRRSLAYIALG
jgi:hypothetical protein